MSNPFYCANCSRITTLDTHGRCSACQSDNVTAKIPERRDQSTVGQLRRAAYRFEHQGQPVMALLLRNDARRLEEREAANV